MGKKEKKNFDSSYFPPFSEQPYTKPPTLLNKPEKRKEEKDTIFAHFLGKQTETRNFSAVKTYPKKKIPMDFAGDFSKGVGVGLGFLRERANYWKSRITLFLLL